MKRTTNLNHNIWKIEKKSLCNQIHYKIENSDCPYMKLKNWRIHSIKLKNWKIEKKIWFYKNFLFKYHTYVYIDILYQT